MHFLLFSFIEKGEREGANILLQFHAKMKGDPKLATLVTQIVTPDLFSLKRNAGFK